MEKNKVVVRSGVVNKFAEMSVAKILTVAPGQEAKVRLIFTYIGNGGKCGLTDDHNTVIYIKQNDYENLEEFFHKSFLNHVEWADSNYHIKSSISYTVPCTYVGKGYHDREFDGELKVEFVVDNTIRVMNIIIADVDRERAMTNHSVFSIREPEILMKVVK